MYYYFSLRLAPLESLLELTQAELLLRGQRLRVYLEAEGPRTAPAAPAPRRSLRSVSTVVGLVWLVSSVAVVSSNLGGNIPRK